MRNCWDAKPLASCKTDCNEGSCCIFNMCACKKAKTDCIKCDNFDKELECCVA